MKKFFVIIFVLITSIYANSCEGKLFSYSNSLNEKDRLSIKNFLYVLATQKCNINVIIKDEKARKILNQKMPFVRIKDYTLTQIMDLILKQRGLFYDLNNNELTISYYKTKNYKIDFISSTRKGEAVLDATNNKITNNYDFNFWDTLKEQLTTLLKNNTENKNIYEPIVNKDTGIVVVTGDMKQIKAVDKFMNNLLNSLTKEVLIDVKIYSVELSKSHKTGIDWSQLSLSLPNSSVPLRAKYIFGSGSIFNSATFNSAAFLNFLAQNGNVNSISNPKIMTLNNQKAIISVGDTIYYKYASKVVTDQNGNPQTQYTIGNKFVGVILDITPQISDDGTIILSIAPRISAFRDLNQLSTQTVRDMPPDTKDNTMLSVVKVKDNDTIVLGGLISDDKSLKVNGVPILKEIPIVKYLFSSKERITNKKELVFVITPHIINLKKKKTLRDLGFGKIQ
ncbi:type II secretion system protein GspD [Caminibacter mediatlanticus]|uniref:Type II protein secretion system D protein n=1 Tax=Caminibacter mediatlanticus TB-2 TaxID=391592 RepID=A0AAI9F2K9_9BACT|nr:type II protein secretion system protein D [Caminibacter mediatlanticus]EDM23914.1 putative type II protein secretion system D protein [Caminibacter mediatlanticus TB-2]